MRFRKTITLVWLCLSLIGLLLVMAALQDIYHNNEPRLTEEWLIVRYGVLTALGFHLWVGFVLFKGGAPDSPGRN